jgi:3-oxoacyl-[acyl-carrier-protein] synthase II
MKRAVITGLGPVSPIGIGISEFWDSIIEHRSGIQRLQSFPLAAPNGACHAAELTGFKPEDWFHSKQLRRLDRFSQFAIVAARLAVENSGLDISALDEKQRSRIGLSFGTALAGFAHAERQHQNFLEGGIRSVTPSLAFQVFGATAHTTVAQDLGIHGPGNTNTNSCAAGNIALGDALRQIRHGEADVVIAGGVEAPIAPLTFAAFDRLNTMSRYHGDDPTRACRPFDCARAGFVIGEGAAVLVVEERQHAISRGARIYAEVAGFAHNSEAYHMTTPEPSGRWIRAVSRAAMDDAELSAERVDHINTHGSGTSYNDLNEGRAIQEVFGSRSKNSNLTLTATKANTGHPLGAAGAIEALIVALSIERSICPATLNWENPEPELDLSISAECRQQRIDVAINHSFGFGGINSATVLRAHR